MGYVSDTLSNFEIEFYDFKTEFSEVRSKVSSISNEVERIERVVGSFDHDHYSDRTIYDIVESIENSINGFRTEIDTFKSSFSRIEKFMDAFERREAEARFDRYWDRHKEYRLELKNKIALLNVEISELENSITANSLNEHIAEMNSRLELIQREKDKLGLFDYKGKKDLKSEITQLNNMLAKVSKQLAKEIEPLTKKIEVLQLEIAKINDELTKPR